MPETDIAFNINIPIREQDAEQIVNAFMQARPYNTTYSNTVQDQAGNTIENPITPLMYVEDCVAFYIMDITKSYLINQTAEQARSIAQGQTIQLVNDLRNYINNN